MHFYRDPFFWALLSMLGLAGATSLFSLHGLRRNPIFVSVVLVLVTVGRAILPLPFCGQPRFGASAWGWVAGGALMALALAVSIQPLFVVRWWDPPRGGMKLVTNGIFGLVRHPIYLAELLWPLGLSILCRSIYGVALTPLWWVAFFVHALAEEADLRRVLGQEYEDYMKRVRGRTLPWLPI